MDLVASSIATKSVRAIIEALIYGPPPEGAGRL